MLYLDEETILQLKPSWSAALNVIEQAIEVIHEGDCVQPLKPYLRFRDPLNRIIAMPSFLGGKFNVSGIKWIASFPNNLQRNLPRAHSLSVLNDVATGKPIAIMNSGLISGIRTAAVSGVLIKSFVKNMPKQKIKIGILGLGPIGRLHLDMIKEVVGQPIDAYLYDIHPETRERVAFEEPESHIVSSWQEAYEEAEIFITCTTSSKAYINKQPKSGSLHLNVSLRDYKPEIIMKCSHLIVDDWDEVCRENTDIERAHIEYGLDKVQTHSLIDVIQTKYFEKIDRAQFNQKEFVLFNPMGMGLFDMALAGYFYDQAIQRDFGTNLKD